MAKKQGLTQLVAERDFGKLLALICVSDHPIDDSDTKNGRWFWGHVYSFGDDDSSHWWFKARSEKTLLNAMVKRFTSANKRSTQRAKPRSARAS